MSNEAPPLLVSLIEGNAASTGFYIEFPREIAWSLIRRRKALPAPQLFMGPFLTITEDELDRAKIDLFTDDGFARLFM